MISEIIKQVPKARVMIITDITRLDLSYIFANCIRVLATDLNITNYHIISKIIAPICPAATFALFIIPTRNRLDKTNGNFN